MQKAEKGGVFNYKLVVFCSTYVPWRKSRTHLLLILAMVHIYTHMLFSIDNFGIISIHPSIDPSMGYVPLQGRWVRALTSPKD